MTIKEKRGAAATTVPSAEKTEDAATGVAAVDRAFLVLTAVEAAHEPVSLSELSRLTGLYKSTILRLIASLERAALLVQRPDLKYELGPFAFRLGRAFDASHKLKERVIDVLERLVAQGTESASFHVRYDDTQRLCLFRVNSRHSTLDNVKAGDLLPLDRGAPAKAIRYFTPLTGQPVEHEAPLVFTSFGEREPSCAAVSCPVFGAHHQFIGALSLSGPLERYSKEAVASMTKLLLPEAQNLTRALGGRWPVVSASRR
jgi:DNA-binding IclR family transcriptional regulator